MQPIPKIVCLTGTRLNIHRIFAGLSFLLWDCVKVVLLAKILGHTFWAVLGITADLSSGSDICQKAFCSQNLRNRTFSGNGIIGRLLVTSTIFAIKFHLFNVWEILVWIYGSYREGSVVLILGLKICCSPRDIHKKALFLIYHSLL